jgi:hypothetical protein
LLAALVQTPGIIFTRTVTTIKMTNAVATNANTKVAIKMIDATTTLVAKRRTSRKRPLRREMIANAITLKRRNGHCDFVWKKKLLLVKVSFLLTLPFLLFSRSSKRSYANHHISNDDRK